MFGYLCKALKETLEGYIMVATLEIKRYCIFFESITQYHKQMLRLISLVDVNTHTFTCISLVTVFVPYYSYMLINSIVTNVATSFTLK